MVTNIDWCLFYSLGCGFIQVSNICKLNSFAIWDVCMAGTLV